MPDVLGPARLDQLLGRDGRRPVAAGGFDAALLEGASLVVASPGVSLGEPIFARARALGLEVVGDIELFARATRGIPTVGITGTNGKSTVTALTGALLTAAGDRYPRMANYSYDYGNVHWLCLDANTYMDWTDEKMRAWVRQDLMSVPKGVWKVVVFHHPPFTSNRKHQREQGMRFLADIFE